MFLEKLLHNQKKAVDPGGTDLRDFCINTRLQVHILRFLEWVISLEVQLTLSLNHFSRLILVNCPFNLLKTRVGLENYRFTTGLIFMGFSSGMNLLYVLYLFRFGWSCDVCLIYLIWVLLQFFFIRFLCWFEVSVAAVHLTASRCCCDRTLTVLKWNFLCKPPLLAQVELSAEFTELPQSEGGFSQ